MGEIVNFHLLLDESKDELAEVGGFSVLALPNFGSVGHLANVCIDLLRSIFRCDPLYFLSLCFLRSNVFRAYDCAPLSSLACLLLFGFDHNCGLIQGSFNVKRHKELRPIFNVAVLEP